MPLNENFSDADQQAIQHAAHHNEISAKLIELIRLLSPDFQIKDNGELDDFLVDTREWEQLNEVANPREETRQRTYLMWKQRNEDNDPDETNETKWDKLGSEDNPDARRDYWDLAPTVPIEEGEDAPPRTRIAAWHHCFDFLTPGGVASGDYGKAPNENSEWKVGDYWISWE